MKRNIHFLTGEYLCAEDPTAAHEIIELAKRDPAEMQKLVNLFYTYEDGNFDDFHDKVRLADLLVYLKYSPVKKFLTDIINDKEPTAKTIKYGPGWSNMQDKIWAAGRLVYMGDIKGEQFLEKIIGHLDQNQLEHLVSELYEEAAPENCSITTLDFLLELADKHEKIAAQINRKKIKAILKRLQAGEIFTWEVPWWDVV